MRKFKDTLIILFNYGTKTYISQGFGITAVSYCRIKVTLPEQGEASSFLQ